jgi:hypothetical protein
MKTLVKSLFAIAFFASIVFSTPLRAQDNYKHPQLNSSGHVLDSTGTKLGWITKEGTIFNSKGEKVGAIVKQELFDSKGHRLGSIGSDGTFKNDQGVMVFYVESKSKGELCKVFDPQGKVIAVVHDSYKNQACAIHCLYKMPQHK